MESPSPEPHQRLTELPQTAAFSVANLYYNQPILNVSPSAAAPAKVSLSLNRR